MNLTITPPEMEVLRGIVAGRMNKQIADDRGRAIGTIKVQVIGLLRKTGTRSRAQLAVWAIRNGVVQ